MSVTFPKGFKVGVSAAGLKKLDAQTGLPKLDTLVITNEGDLRTAAAVFTSNRVHAAPVKYSRGALAATGGKADAVVVNSGNANACTGEAGLEQARETAEFAAQYLGIADLNKVLIASTGLIGKLLDLPKLLGALGVAARELSNRPAAGENAAVAIMTTDTVPKTSKVDTGNYRIGGIAKGAGMLAPELATMICIITTDAVLQPKDAKKALEAAVQQSFNRIDVDGCMSTNDTVLLLASGESGVEPDLAEFTQNLITLQQDLAKQMVQDAEGASHVIEITVENASSESAALAVARAIANSNLFKCAVFGNDPNWGRVLAAAGVVPESVAPFDPDKMNVSINGIMVAKNGGAHIDRNQVDLSERHVEVVVDLNAGDESATILTTDLTYEYVKENADYST
jgi:glutamate N-acetyltransferase/amino-acid N-acetyltransferase